MRLLIANPNTSADMTEGLLAVARAAASPDTSLVAITAPRGVPYISSRVEAQVAGAILLETLAREAAGFDAVVIAAYGDPGLTAAREMLDIPVVGMAEAAMLTACMLGQRFAVVTFAARLLPWFAEGVAHSGLAGRFAGFHVPDQAFGALADVQQELRQPLVALCHRAAADGADVAVLAGAPLAGMAADIAGSVPLVTLDPIAAAVRQAETLARLAPRGASAGSFARPPAKRSHGLDPALADWIAGKG